jgi:hypothetical protein
MSRWAQLQQFLETDPSDIGCARAMEVLHVYVDLVLAGAQPDLHLPEVSAHLSACGPCNDDFEGLLAAVRGTPLEAPDPTKGTTVPVKLAILALLEAKPDKGPDLGAFLEQGRALAVAEQGTVSWYAFKLSDTQYGIFDTFETEEARNAHLNGEIPAVLSQVGADLLAKSPDIQTVDVIAVK